jgi:hypothetical protein
MISTATAAVNAVAVGAPVTSQKPRGGQCECDHDRHEYRRDPVGQPLHPGLAVLRLLYQPCHLGQPGVRTDPGSPHPQPTGDVHRPAGYRRARVDLDRDRLAGEHARVNGGGPVHHLAVGGDLLSRADHELVADQEHLDGDTRLPPIPQHRDIPGADVQQRTQRRTRPPLGARLEVATSQQEHRHARGDLQIDLGITGTPVHRQAELMPEAQRAGAAEDHRVATPQERREHTH